jgi:hypothetical protein
MTAQVKTASPTVRFCASLWADVKLSTIAASFVGYPYHFSEIVEKVPSWTMTPISARNKSATRAASGCLGEEAMPDHNVAPGIGDIRNSQPSGLPDIEA